MGAMPPYWNKEISNTPGGYVSMSMAQRLVCHNCHVNFGKALPAMAGKLAMKNSAKSRK
jgi:hypothetical protein